MDDKNIAIIIGVVAVILVLSCCSSSISSLLGGFFTMNQSNKSQEPSNDSTNDSTNNKPTKSNTPLDQLPKRNSSFSTNRLDIGKYQVNKTADKFQIYEVNDYTDKSSGSLGGLNFASQGDKLFIG